MAQLTISAYSTGVCIYRTFVVSHRQYKQMINTYSLINSLVNSLHVSSQISLLFMHKKAMKLDHFSACMLFAIMIKMVLDSMKCYT